ncbi:hypothetical protein D3C71_1542400 [compost metagenome]
MNLPLVDGLDDRRRVDVPGQHDPRGLRIEPMDMRQQRGTVHIGHACIAHHQIHRLLRHDFQRLRATAGQQHIVGLAAQQAAQTAEDRFLVIDQQHLGSTGQRRGGLLFHGMASSEP